MVRCWVNSANKFLQNLEFKLLILKEMKKSDKTTERKLVLETNDIVKKLMSV